MQFFSFQGFAIKFYTEEGIWDLVGNNTPVFFMRDPILFPMFIHTQKRNPVTNTRDWNMFWDYLSLRPESLHQVLILFSDRGIPDGHRHQNGYGSHTFSLIGPNRKLTWVKFIYKTDQGKTAPQILHTKYIDWVTGIKNLEPEQANALAGTQPDYALEDLYNAIASGNYPSWTFYIQTMTPEQAKQVNFNPFDITKVWHKKQFPLKKVGRFVLNRNPANYFAEVEQLAFQPSNLTPGISRVGDIFYFLKFYGFLQTLIKEIYIFSRKLYSQSIFDYSKKLVIFFIILKFLNFSGFFDDQKYLDL